MSSWFRKTEPTTLPPGDLGRSVVGNTFSFHSDAQSVILDNIERYPNEPAYRAKVIGRDVALIVDHTIACKILQPTSTETTRFSHREAYNQLIAAYFAEPNILLEDDDEPDRPEHRAQWDEHFASFLSEPIWGEMENRSKQVIAHWLHTQPDGPTDLYATCKALSKDLLYDLVLGLNAATESEEYQRLSDVATVSSKGQFAIPLKGSMGGFFETTYSKGLKAQHVFNATIEERLQSGRCPFMSPKLDRISDESKISHTAMFSSPLVVKALASLLTFSLLHLSRRPTANLDHLMLETERLNPPIIGVLRRVLDQPWKLSENREIPVGWDVWLYFPMINRDERVYGADARMFNPDRWTGDTPHGMTFGVGPKQCIGREFSRRLVKMALSAVKDAGGVSVDESSLDGSLRDFLGWATKGERSTHWRGVKQLPVQKPRQAVLARLG